MHHLLFIASNVNVQAAGYHSDCNAMTDLHLYMYVVWVHVISVKQDREQTCHRRDAAVPESDPTSHSSTETCVQRLLCVEQHSAADSDQHKYQCLVDAASLTPPGPNSKPTSIAHCLHSTLFSISTSFTLYSLSVLLWQFGFFGNTLAVIKLLYATPA